MPRSFRPAIGLGVLLFCGLLLSAQTVREQVSVQTRTNPDGQRSLLIQIGSRFEGRVVDEVTLTLPGKAAREASAPFMPAGWSFSTAGRKVRWKGPASSQELLRFRLQVGGAAAPRRLRVELRSSGRRLFREEVPVEPLPPVSVAGSLQGLVVFPQAVSPGEEIELRVLDPRLTPTPGVWEISGQVAEVVDRKKEEGATGEPPWIRVRLGDALAVGQTLAVRYHDPWGERLVDVPAVEDVAVVAPPAAPLPGPRISACGPQAFAGQSLCVCGWFPDEAARRGLRLDGQPLQPVSASNRVVNLSLPPETAPGRHRISGDETLFPPSDGAEVLVLAVQGQIDRDKLLRGETTTMSLRVLGTDLPLRIRLSEATGVVSLEGGPDQVVETSGGSNNLVQRQVRAVRSGDFHIRYRLEADPCPCATESLPASPARVPTPPGLPPAQTPGAPTLRPGDGIAFEVVIENGTEEPQPAVLYDPVPQGASHLDPNSVRVRGSATEPVNESGEAIGVVVTGITVPPGGRVTVSYTFFVAAGTPQGFVVTNSAYVNRHPTDAAAAPPVDDPASGERPLKSTKRYTGTRPGGPPRPTVPRPGEPPLPPVTTPPELPPHRPPEEVCDCCCYKNLQWSTGNAIRGDIIVPSNDPVQVPLGAQLPLAAEAFDSDLLTVSCQRRGCGARPCPPCSSQTIMQMADRLHFHWRIVSGGGMIDTRPHLHSNERATSAAVFRAPDVLPANPNVVVELVIDDSPEKLTDVDDAPLKKQLRIQLVAAGAGNANLHPKPVSPGPVITPGSGESCPCRPRYRWTAGDALKATLALPRYVCEKGFDLFAAPGGDSDLLTVGCRGGCSTSSSDARRRLNDPLYYRWTVSAGAVLGGAREEVVFQGASPGPVDVRLRVQDSGTQYSDPVVDLRGRVTVVGIGPSTSGDYIVPFSKENIIRYILKPAALVADRVILEVLDKNGKLMRRLEDLPRSNDATTGYAQYKWNGLTRFQTPLREAHSPYTYRITMIKGEARCRLKEEDRKVKEWDLSYNIVDRGQQLAGRKAGASGIEAKTVVPTLVLTKVQPQGGDQVQVPVYLVEERTVNASEKLAKVTQMNSFEAGDKFFLYTSPTSPNTIGYTVTIESQAGGALDKAGNEWDMNPQKTGIQRKQIWKFHLDKDGKYQSFREEIKD